MLNANDTNDMKKREQNSDAFPTIQNNERIRTRMREAAQADRQYDRVKALFI